MIDQPTYEAQAGAPVGDWHPARYTPTLTGTEEFTTEGDKLLDFTARYVTIPTVRKLTLDPWQPWLIRHVLETYPPDWPVVKLRGKLRYRQVLISMGRQNGKSLIGLLLVLYFLVLHVRGPRVVGLASIDRQAKIVYDRVKFAIDNNPTLARELRTTATPGIHRRDGTGLYQTLPADEDAAQGEPVTGCLYDELHLGLAALWHAMVLAQRANPYALMVGLTTAGDADSDLLITLYTDAAAAIAGNDERFGAFIWEAPDDELTEAGVIAANPGIACGRIDLETAMHEAEKMFRQPQRDKAGLTGKDRVVRYTLNRFLTESAGSWISLAAWADSAGLPDLEAGDHTIYGIARTDSWEGASIVATTTLDGIAHTELVATLTDASYELLAGVCRVLNKRGPSTFVMPAAELAGLANTLREEGLDVWKLAAGETHAADQHSHATIARRRLIHAGDPLLALQHRRAKRRDTADGWHLSQGLSTGHIDAIRALNVSLYVAALRGEETDQIF